MEVSFWCSELRDALEWFSYDCETYGSVSRPCRNLNEKIWNLCRDRAVMARALPCHGRSFYKNIRNICRNHTVPSPCRFRHSKRNSKILPYLCRVTAVQFSQSCENRSMVSFLTIPKPLFLLDANHDKLTEMVSQLSEAMTGVKHEQEYMEVRERIHRSSK